MRNDIVGYGDIICVFPVSYIKHGCSIIYLIVHLE